MSTDRTKTTAAGVDDIALANSLRDGRTAIMAELRKLIVGQEAVIDANHAGDAAHRQRRLLVCRGRHSR